MTEREPPDQTARDAIRTRLDKTILVEAAAGTGKTTSLVERMANLVRSGRARASSIAAITFTVKAAAHLREAFQEKLERELRESKCGDGLQPVPERAEARSHIPLAKALEEIDRGFIGTTHAFCARLLRERPVEAGLDPEFEELDETAARQLTAEFWNRWYESEAAGGNALIAEARELGLDRRTLRSAFAKIVEYPDVELISERRPRPNLQRVVDALSDFLDEVEPHLPNDTHRDIPDEFEKLMVTLLRERRKSDLDEPFEQFAFLDEGNRASRKPVQKRWPDKAIAKNLGDRYRDFVLTELRPTVQQWREHVHGVAIELLRPAAAAYAAERRRNGTLTFQDLLVCARDLLRDNAPVRRYFQRRFTHLLVDEFQDTDPLQAEVLFFMTGEDVEEKNWKKLRPRPGSLFIVGDPKQSIYRFRRADITTYLDVKERIEKSGGEILQLSTNFRSLPAICTFVNEAFTTLFDPDDVAAGRQAQHVDLTSGVEVMSDKRGDGLQPVPERAEARSHIDVTPQTSFAFSRGKAPAEAGAPLLQGVYHLETPDDKPTPMAAAEAQCVAQWITRAVEGGMLIDEGGKQRPIEWRDIMLVSWQRPRLREYARAFEKAGVPYEITGSRAFSEVEELESVMPVLQAVIEPDDEVAIVAFLRGPLCGADDDALYRFVRSGGHFSLFRDLPEGADERIARGLSMLRETIKDAGQYPPVATIARLFDRLGLLPLAASREQPGTRAGHLLLALTLARDLSSRGESLAGIVGHFEDLLEDPPEIEELDVDPRRSEAVRLMNLHQVKGLEAPIVFLIDPADDFDFPIDLFVDRAGEQSRGHFVVAREWGRGTKQLALPVGWDAHEQTEKAFKNAEKRRQLYVAATRAKNMLVIGFRQTARGVRGAWRDLATRASKRLDMPDIALRRVVERHAATKQFAAARDEISARFDHARETSYSVLPITKIAHASHAELVRAEEGLGKGTSWGRVLHRLFEAMLRDASLDIRLYAGNLLKDEERDPVELAEVMRVVDAVRSSPLWKRVLAANERYVEVPFALEVSRRDVGLNEDGDTLLHGTIDLVFREGGQWFIVDYKSDSTVGRLDALVAYYKPQVEHYARFWSQLTGAPASGGLFFVDGSIERWV